MRGVWQKMVCPNGVEFNSIASMLRYYNIKRATYYGRRQLGWDLKRALLGSRSYYSVACTCHNGIYYSSKTKMCAAYGISVSAFAGRIKWGWDLERALTQPLKKDRKQKEPNWKKRQRKLYSVVSDHNGVDYTSPEALAEAYGLKYRLYQERLGRGWDLERTLTTPLRIQGKQK
jgi:hypothetical protein